MWGRERGWSEGGKGYSKRCSKELKDLEARDAHLGRREIEIS